MALTEKQLQYRRKHLSNGGQEKANEYMKEWRKKNKHKMEEYKERYREKSSTYSLEWYRSKDKEHVNNIRRRSNAKRRALKYSTFVEHVDIKILLERDKEICQLCREQVNTMDKLNYTIDHIVPISRGGEHSYANTQLAHRKCNCRKHNKLMEDFVGKGTN